MNLPTIQKQSLSVEVLSQEEYEIVRRNYARDATDDEFKMFLGICRHNRLDPFKNQVYFAKIKGKVAIMVSIGALRDRAIESGFYDGSTLPLYCGEDGVWKEIWPHKHPPFACKIGVRRKGFSETQYAIAEWNSYVKTFYNKDRNQTEISPMWASMGNHMLAKCAEALAIRKAFSSETDGMYTREEMDHAESKSVILPQIPQKTFSQEQKDLVVRKITEVTENCGLAFHEIQDIRREMYKDLLSQFKDGLNIDNIDYTKLLIKFLPHDVLENMDRVNIVQEEKEVEDVEF